jgi:hypothetical protein
MEREDGCEPHVLAAERCCRIEQCTHGTLHLTIGALTLRLAPEHLAELATALGTAVQRLGIAESRRSDRLLC